MTYRNVLDIAHIHGPFLGSHAISEGWLGRKQLRSPLFVRLFHNVYLPAAIPVTHELRCRAAATIAPATATLTGCSAAAVYGFDFAAAYDPVEFVVDEDDKFTAQRGMDIRRSTIGPVSGDPWHEIQLATPLRMTLDILTNTKLRRSLPRVVGYLDALLRSGIIVRRHLELLLEARHDRGIVRARHALALADPRAESIPESEVRIWLVCGGLTPEPQVDVYDGHGRFLGRLDLAFPEYRIAVEYDGSWHGNPEQARLDAQRRSRMEAEGWTFIIVTKAWLRDDPRGIVDAVRAAIRQREVAR
ncbi:MAG: endonuclease domain-containing protein [Haloechinothrix sp.]